MDISTITHVTSDYIKNALEESAKASKQRRIGRNPVFFRRVNEYSRFADCPGKGKCSITVHSSCKR